jgi:hypothetical protein
MSYNLILNSNNVTGQNKNIYKFNFINGAFTINSGAEICVSSITLPYSFFNITAQYGNNTFQFLDWLNILHNITLPDGFYQVSDVQQYLQTYFLNNGLYLINTTGQNVFYLFLNTNIAYYANQILTYIVPTSLPSGWSAPINFIGFPLISISPSLIILNNNFQNYLGFSVGSYPLPPNNTLDQSFLSNITPNTTIVNAIICRVSIVNNTCSSPSDVLDQFNINATFGSNITYSPNYEKWIKCSSGSFNSLTITFVDQNFNTIIMNDSNVAISLLLKN